MPVKCIAGYVEEAPVNAALIVVHKAVNIQNKSTCLSLFEVD
jgi:hypothetical protein